MAEQGGSNLFSRGGQAESCVRAEELRGRGDTGRVFRKLIQCDQKIRKSQAVNLAVPIWRRCIESEPPALAGKIRRNKSQLLTMTFIREPNLRYFSQARDKRQGPSR